MLEIIKKLVKKIILSRAIFCFRLFNYVPLPKIAIIDPSTVCNLGCPLCPTGTKKLRCEKMFMSVPTFKKILEEIPTLRVISLFNWGEAFLNPNIFEIISLAKEKKIYLSLHSNFSFSKNRDFFENIVKSKLDNLEISLDGASKETYGKYRRGGDFDLVIENIQKLTEAKKQLESQVPRITWKFIVNRHNETEIEKARKMARDLGVAFFATKIGLADNLPEQIFTESIQQKKADWLPENKKYIRPEYLGEYKNPLNENICEFLFSSVTISPDGKVYPCCFLADENNCFGDLKDESFATIWNGKKYSWARSLFIKNKTRQSIPVICEKCNNFKKK